MVFSRLGISGGQGLSFAFFSLLCLLTPPLIAKDKSSEELDRARDALLASETEISNLEGLLRVAQESINNLTVETRYYVAERRLLDADLYYEAGDCERAATLYSELLENPSFKGNPGYYPALYKLADCLYGRRNFASARKYYSLLVTTEAKAYYSLAVARLFEICVLTNEYFDCEPLEPIARQMASSSPEVQYEYGRYLLHRHRKSEAEEMLARVPQSSPLFSRAQYLMGVIAVSSKRYTDALERFLASGSQLPSTQGDIDVLALAHMASARVLVLLGQTKEALEVINKVPPTSSFYPESLYDKAWIEVKTEDMEAAARTLEILSMMQPSGDLGLKCAALRARILTRTGDPETAREVYDELASVLGPVARELDALARDPKGLESYFQWVIAKNTGAFHMEVPVSENTARWLENSPDVAAIATLFSDIGEETKATTEALSETERIIWALKSSGGIISFPALKEKIVQLKVTENRLLVASARALDGVKPLLAGKIGGDARQRYEKALKARETIWQKVASLPTAVEAYSALEESSLSEIMALERDLFVVETLLEEQRREVLAIEEWLRNEKARGDPRLTQEREDEVRKVLEEEKGELERIRKDALALREKIEREMIKVKARSEQLASEDAIRAEAWKVMLEETLALEGALGVLDKEGQEVLKATVALVQRAAKLSGTVPPLVRAVEDIARKGSEELVSAVSREHERLEETLSLLKKVEKEAHLFANAEIGEVFKRVSRKMREVLLEADLGLVEMAWQRYENTAARVKQIGFEGSAALGALQKVEDLLKGPSQGAKAKGQQEK